LQDPLFRSNIHIAKHFKTMALPSKSFEVFVSHARAEWRCVGGIDSILRASGLTSFADGPNLPPGPRPREPERGLNAAKALVILIGLRGLRDTQQYERDLALIRHTRNAAFPAMPVILPRRRAILPPISCCSWAGLIYPMSQQRRMSRTCSTSFRRQSTTRTLRLRQDEKKSAPAGGSTRSEKMTPRFSSDRWSAHGPTIPIDELFCKVGEYPFVMVAGRSGAVSRRRSMPACCQRYGAKATDSGTRPRAAATRSSAAAYNPRADNE
jgi:hypothetical protein